MRWVGKGDTRDQADSNVLANNRQVVVKEVAEPGKSHDRLEGVW